MADVIPFRGIRYNRQKLSDLSLVISPPYDIISPAEQQGYHDKHSHNAIRLDFGVELAGDDDQNNRYTRAAEAFSEWQTGKILTPEPRPAFYLCREEFLLGDGTTAIRDGFIALIRLADFSEGIVLPHEETASGPKADRLRLMQATGANLSAIFCLYADPGQPVIKTLTEASAEDPDIRIKDEAGTVHSLWVVDDPVTTAAINETLSNKTLLIADGHHRYETALAYRDARRAEDGPGPEKPYDFLMVYLSDMENTGQSILPIHRFVSGISTETMGQLEASLLEKFQLTEITGSAAERQEKMVKALAEASDSHNVFGMYLPGRDSYHLLTGRENRPMIDAGETGGSASYRSLDIAVLDRLILGDILGIRPDGPNQSAKVRFVERTEKALSELSTPGLDVVFLVNATSMEEIRAVAGHGEKMPQKSTYFYPKPVTGLVFRSFDY